MFDKEKEIVFNGKKVLTREVVEAIIPILEELEDEWTGENRIDYIKFKLGLIANQYKDKDYGDKVRS